MDIAVVDELLSTTRSVRRRLDLTRPVEPEVIERCLELAIQAPNGGNACRYHFVVVTDPAKRLALAELYRAAYAELRGPGPAATAFDRSNDALADTLHLVPLLIVPCIQARGGDPTPFRLASRYGSILPATWSLMLALRARGLGSAWTTAHLLREREAAALLEVPDDVTQVAMLPVAYFTGAGFRPAERVPARERTYWNAWGRTR